MSVATRPGRNPPQRGFTLPELMVASFLFLVIGSGLATFLISSQRTVSRLTANASALGDAGLALDRLGAAARSAGFDPLGVGIVAVPAAGSSSVTFAADLDGDGRIDPVASPGEQEAFRFEAQAAGTLRLLRVVDRNGDGDGQDSGEQEEVLAADLEAADLDGDGQPEPLLGYDDGLRPRLIRVCFAARTVAAGPAGGRSGVPVLFQAAFHLRNGAPPPPVVCAAP